MNKYIIIMENNKQFLSFLNLNYNIIIACKNHGSSKM
jgi:hypothetical protein